MNDVKKLIEDNKIITICRGVYGDQLVKLMEALYAGGIRMAEVTFDQKSEDYKETLDSIKQLSEHFEGKLAVGAGTVITPEQVRLAKDAGAQYIISPNIDKEVVAETKKLGLISIPGTLTATEALEAHKAGADFVKLFPAATMSVKYMKDLMGPLSHIKFIAAGGINETNITEYEAIGCAGYGISGRLTDKKLLAEENYEEFTKRAKDFVSKLQK